MASPGSAAGVTAARLASYEPADLQSLPELLEEVPDPRHGRALRYRLSAVLALLVLSRVAGKEGGRHMETFSRALRQKELEFLGCPLSRRIQQYEAPLGHDLPAGAGERGAECPRTRGATLGRAALSAATGAGGGWQAGPQREPPESGRPSLGDCLAGRSP